MYLSTWSAKFRDVLDQTTFLGPPWCAPG